MIPEPINFLEKHSSHTLAGVKAFRTCMMYLYIILLCGSALFGTLLILNYFEIISIPWIDQTITRILYNWILD